MHEEYHELMNRMETSLQVVETLGFVFDGTMIIIPVDRLGQWPSGPVAQWPVYTNCNCRVHTTNWYRFQPKLENGFSQSVMHMHDSWQ